ncbi:MAG TPA: hypothetical protein IAB39_10140 [Candidatus Onthovicinus excrementipullorum]|nr:hypothetical protein [Candidatus Onthovicinus excrementipullorum]
MKKSKKILSLGLATAMAFSIGASAFAASAAENEPAYTPTYNDRVTEEKVGELITMADGLLESAVWANYGSTVIGSLLGVFPGLGGEFATAEFYQKIDAEVFADLTGEVTADSLAAYLAEHPIAAASSTEVVANLGKVLPAALEGLFNMTVVELMPGFGITVATLMQTLTPMCETLFAGIDELADILGADVGEEDITTILTAMNNVLSNTSSSDEVKAAAIKEAAEKLSAYIMGIVDLLAPNTVNQVLGLVKIYSDNQGAVMTCVNTIFSELSSVLASVAEVVAGFGVQLDLSQIQNTVTSIEETISANTVKAEDGTITGFDFDALVNQLLTDNGINTFVAVVADGAESTAMLKLSSINDLIASFADEGVSSSADVLMVAYNYVYDNLLGNESNKTALLNVLNLLPSVLPSLGLDPSLVETINGILPSIPGMIEELTANGPLGLLDTVMVMLGILEDPNAVTPTDPTQPGTEGGDNTNPGTGDAALGAVVMMGTAAAAAIVLLRRKK